MLTRSELMLLADAAERYPPGCGDSYFSDAKIDRSDEVVDRMVEDPRCVEYG